MKKHNRVKIANKWIGDGEPCFIIAEAGSNHDQKLSQAKKLIDVAKAAGADAVKFQIYTAEGLYTKNLKTLPGENKKPFQVIKSIETPRKWIPLLASYAKKQDLIFFASPFDKKAIDMLNPHVPAFKWASPELIDRPLLEYAAKKKKPIIISTGFHRIDQVEDAVRWCRKVGNTQLILLQCTGLYPLLPKEVNLRVMGLLKKKFSFPVGFSDHTISTVIPAAAVAMGANVVEKHFTLNRKLKGPDHPFALEPDELKEMVRNIRNVEKSMGSEKDKPVKREIAKEKLIRRGIVALGNIKKGEKITALDITTKRAGAGGIVPKYFYEILGKTVLRDIKADEKLTWRIIKKSSNKRL